MVNQYKIYGIMIIPK